MQKLLSHILGGPGARSQCKTDINRGRGRVGPSLNPPLKSSVSYGLRTSMDVRMTRYFSQHIK